MERDYGQGALKMNIEASLRRVQDQIEDSALKNGRRSKDIRLVVVTKEVPLDKIREAVKAGACILGESRIQEARPKMESIAAGVTWDLIGTLQRNKARNAVGRFEIIHSVDQVELARELDRRAAQKDIIQRVLVQVNVAGETGKHGVTQENAMKVLMEMFTLPNLKVLGLMTIPPLPNQPVDSRPYYRKLRNLARSIEEESGVDLSELSMGMSRDFEVAIEEGATMVRVGTAIFS